MAWYVASLRDGDTHLGSKTSAETACEAVSAPCGQTFRPLARLTGTPADPLQVCQACRDHKTINESQKHVEPVTAKRRRDHGQRQRRQRRWE